MLLEKRKRKIRADLTEWCIEALAPFNQTPAAHHRLLIRELESVARGECDRLMVEMPPGSAKSTYVMLFSAWFLAQAPNLSVICASYGAQLAESISFKAQGFVSANAAALGYGLATESRELWQTTNGGQYRAAGVGGGITGFRADLAIIDDPVRDQKDADSVTYRDTAWDWYHSSLVTRLKPGGRVIIVMTRWHEDDLAGRLIETQGNMWRRITLPAQAGAADPLGRLPGEWLWSDDASGYGALLQRKKIELESAGKAREWNALYQQDPRPAEGMLFKVDKLGFVDDAPAGKKVRAWDFAATAGGGDWTVGVLMCAAADGTFCVEDVKRAQVSPENMQKLIVDTAMEDGRGVQIFLPRDPGAAGVSLVYYLTKALAGFRVENDRETGEKQVRAVPYSSQVNIGAVKLRRASWNMTYREELRGFPAGKHDDQVDASSSAFNWLTAAPGPPSVRRIGY